MGGSLSPDDKLRAAAQREISALEDAMRSGYHPTGMRGSTNKKSGLRVVADALGISVSSLRHRVGTPGHIGIWGRKFGLIPDWTLYTPKAEAPIEFVAADVVTVERKRMQDRDFASENRKLREALSDAHDIRGGIAGLFSDPPIPRSLPMPVRKGAKAGEVPLINLYDLQWGEVVDINAMGGINSYNAVIAKKRLGRFFSTIIDLLTKHWHGPPPPKAYFALGGDLVSGQIHDLPKTNDRSGPEAVRDLVGVLKDGIEKLAFAIKCPIEVISVPGNHGRITEFPDDKRYVVDSYDTLVAWLLELHFNRPGSTVTVTIPPSGDALVNIYGRNVLWTHGDKIGAMGGHGGAGVAAPAARGMRRIFAEYSELGVRLHAIIMGHLHTALELEDGFVSASLVGPSERGRRFRFKPSPASQWLLTMHPHYGIAQRWKIQVGDPSEGSIYETPAGARAA